MVGQPRRRRIFFGRGLSNHRDFGKIGQNRPEITGAIWVFLGWVFLNKINK